MVIYKLPSSFLDPQQTPDETSFDDPKRMSYHQSRLQGFLHLKEKHSLDVALQTKVLSFFQERYGYSDQKDFKRIWKKVGADQAWNVSIPLTAKVLRNIDQTFRAKLFYHGNGVEAPPNPPLNTDKTIQILANALFHGGKLSSQLLQMRALQAVFVKKDEELLHNFRKVLQSEFDFLAKNPPRNPQEELIWRSFLGHLIAFLPFSYPHPQELVSIPILEDGKCRLVDYKMEVIPLTSSDVESPMTALGLTPVEEKAPPILTFLGTTYPAGDGFLATILADFTPGHSVGEAVYHENEKTLDKWLEGKTNVHTIGISLGGALALHIFRHHAEKLSKVDVYKPPGLYSECWEKEIPGNVPINIYCQPGDIVSKLGYWPTAKNVSLYEILPHQPGVENLLSSHARVFLGCKKITILKLDPEIENRQPYRKFLTTLHKHLGPYAIYFPMQGALWFQKLTGYIYNLGRRLFSDI